MPLVSSLFRASRRSYFNVCVCVCGTLERGGRQRLTEQGARPRLGFVTPHQKLKRPAPKPARCSPRVLLIVAALLATATSSVVFLFRRFRGLVPPARRSLRAHMAAGLPAGGFDALFLASWRAVKAVPGLMRTTSFEDTQRRTLGPTGAVVQFNAEHLKNKRPTALSMKPEDLLVVRPVVPAHFK